MMRMRIIIICFIICSANSLSLQAGTLEAAFKNAKVDGYLRGGYQYHNLKNDQIHIDDAIGGKLHIETAAISGISGGVSFYSSNSINHDDNSGLVPFRGADDKSYSILGEAYLKANFGNTMIKIGRQEIETPFAQLDDIGMIPNTFEAAILVNKDIKDTTIFLGQIQKMAGVDAEVVDQFTNINDNNNMQAIGINYEGIKDISLSGWYYRLKDAEIDNIAYLEASYEGSSNGFGYGLDVQYAKQTYNIGKTANIFGAAVSATLEKIGLTLATAYTKVKGNAATSGFGGGPFFTNSEYLIIDNAGVDAKATWYGAEWNADLIGVKGLSFGLGKLTLETETGKKSTEIDLVASYEIDDNIEINMIYSDIDSSNVGEDNVKHLRIFANYHF
jgi:hypothetical protein